MTKMGEKGLGIDEEMQEKCNRVIDMLSKRDLERKLEMKRDKDNRQNFVAENEKLDYFEQSFAEKYEEIEIALLDSKDLPSNKLPDHFNNISKNILTLQKYVAASNIFLKTYTIKKYQQKLQELTNKAKELEDMLLPKKRFGFKNKKNKVIDVIGNSNGKDEADFCNIKEKEKRSFKYENENEICGFKNRVGEIVELKAGEMLKKDVALQNLEKCTVKLFGAPSTLHMNGLKNCYIFCGPVSTSIFAENCDNCTFVIACQQLRLHSSTNINIYLHVTSRAIMEDCSHIYFAPYNLKYKNLHNDFNTAGLDMSTNHWNDVDDFNWLNVEKHSPNWSQMENAKIIGNWDHMLKGT